MMNSEAKGERFVNIHSHTEFSLLDGAAKIKEIVDRVKAMGQDAVAITDHGVMHGIVKGYKYASEQGVKLLIGCEFYLAPYGKLATDKEFKKGEKSAYHLIALAKNKKGYENLCKLNAMAWAKGFYRKPRIDRVMLAAHSEGLIVTSACMAGPISVAILDGNMEQATDELRTLQGMFGPDFYMEIQDHGIPEETLAMDKTRELAIKHGINMVVGVDSHYLLKSDEEVHDALICIGSGQKVDGERRFKFSGSGYWYMSEQEVLDRFPRDKQAVLNTGLLADKIESDIITTGVLRIPHFEVPGDGGFKSWNGASKWLKQ